MADHKQKDTAKGALKTVRHKRHYLRKLLMLPIVLLMLGAFYLAVILGTPTGKEDIIRADRTQPLLNASPAVSIGTGEQVGPLLDSLPVPVMYASESGRLTLMNGVAADVAFEGGFARMVTLHYQDESGQEMTVTSVYPARAITLIGRDGFDLSSKDGQSLCGMRTVRMEKTGLIRLHAQSETALYAVTVPDMTDESLSAITSSLLLSPAAEDRKE